MKKYLVLGMALLMVLSVMVSVAAASDPQGEGVQKLRPKDTASPLPIKGELINLKFEPDKTIKAGSWVTFNYHELDTNWPSCTAFSNWTKLNFIIDGQSIINPEQYYTLRMLNGRCLVWFLYHHPPFSAGEHSWTYTLVNTNNGSELFSMSGTFKVIPPERNK